MSDLGGQSLGKSDYSSGAPSHRPDEYGEPQMLPWDLGVEDEPSGNPSSDGTDMTAPFTAFFKTVLPEADAQALALRCIFLLRNQLYGEDVTRKGLFGISGQLRQALVNLLQHSGRDLENFGNPVEVSRGEVADCLYSNQSADEQVHRITQHELSVIVQVLKALTHHMAEQAPPIGFARAWNLIRRQLHTVVGEHTYTRSEQPKAFSQGGSAHIILAKMPALIIDLGCGMVTIMKTGKNEFGFYRDSSNFAHEATANGMCPLFPMSDDDTLSSAPCWALQSVDELVPPDDGESSLSWCVRHIQHALAELGEQENGIPMTTDEVATALALAEQRKAISKVLHVMHVVFGPRQCGALNLSISAYETDQPGRPLGMINLAMDDQPRLRTSVLDWLALASQFIALASEYYTNPELFANQHTSLIEFRMGTIVLDGIRMDGGKADEIIIRSKPTDTGDPDEMAKIYQFSGVGGSNGSNPGIEDRLRHALRRSNQRGSRNLFSLFARIAQGRTSTTLQQIEIEIRDAKFIVGDGSGNTPIRWTPSFAPPPRHIQQIRRYQFFAAAQLTYVYKFMENLSTPPSITVADVVAYAEKYGFDNIRGTLRYFFPHREIAISVPCTSDMLAETGQMLLNDSRARQGAAQTYAIARALRLILSDKFRGLTNGNGH